MPIVIDEDVEVFGRMGSFKDDTQVGSRQKICWLEVIWEFE